MSQVKTHGHSLNKCEQRHFSFISSRRTVTAAESERVAPYLHVAAGFKVITYLFAVSNEGILVTIFT